MQDIIQKIIEIDHMAQKMTDEAIALKPPYSFERGCWAEIDAFRQIGVCDPAFALQDVENFSVDPV